MLRTMLHASILTVLVAVSTGIANPALSDVLLIEEVRESMRRDLPSNGLTKAEVRQRFGDPAREHSPVGEPPISRWEYEEYSVYFEHDLVLDSVLNRGAVLDRMQGGG
ncbi:MAG: hypothetical protein ACNS61_00750 [Candidatus Wenzhouxiangella sp. M2_3B_020]